MSTIETINDLMANEAFLKHITKTMAFSKTEVLKKLEIIISTFSDKWDSKQGEVAVQLNALVDDNNVQYDNDSSKEYSFDSLMWSIGNYLPIFNESCNVIQGCEIINETADLSFSHSKDIYLISVAYEDQDGFEISLPKYIFDLFDQHNPKELIFKDAIDKYVESRIKEALSKIENEWIPQMNSIPKKKTKSSQTKLEEQAASLGFKLVKM